MTAAPFPSLEQIAAYLGRWVAVPHHQLAPIGRYIDACTCPRGDWLFRPGDAADDIVFLTHGLVRVFQVREDREVNLRLLTAPSAAMPYHAYLRQQPSDEYLEALTDVTGFRIRFRSFCREHPGLFAETLQRVLAEHHFLAMQRRVRLLQAGSAARRYQVFLDAMEPDVVRLTPALHVASYLGITPESLSRVRAQHRKATPG